jgi:hypothetical protein
MRENSAEDGVLNVLLAHFGFFFIANRPGPLIGQNLTTLFGFYIFHDFKVLRNKR